MWADLPAMWSNDPKWKVVIGKGCVIKKCVPCFCVPYEGINE